MPIRRPVSVLGLVLAVFLNGCGTGTAVKSDDEDTGAKNGSAAKPAFTPLSLATVANQRLNLPPQTKGQGNNLGNLPRGKQTLAGVPFEIGTSYIQLGSQRFPSRVLLVRGVAVDRTVKRLHFLHAASFSDIHRNDGTGQKEGDVIGFYVVHYTDRSQAEVPIVYGQDVRDWWNWDQSKPVSSGRVGWTGTNTYAARFNVGVRLYVSHWDNPHPRKRIATIDFRSENSISAPLCVAITAEGQ